MIYLKTVLSLTGYQQTDDIEQKSIGVYLQDEMQWNKLYCGRRVTPRWLKAPPKTTATTGSDTKTTVNEANQTSGRLSALYQSLTMVAPASATLQSF